MADVQVETQYGREFYSVETPRGERWSWDEEDLDAEYIEDTLFAWSRLLDFVKARDERD